LNTKMALKLRIGFGF